LMALALGAPANAIGLQRNLVPITPILAKKEIAYA
jgi:heterodisulfide reductase subunit B